MSVTLEEIKEVLDIVSRDTVASEAWYRTQREAWAEYFSPLEWLTKRILLDAAREACRDSRGFAPKIIQVRDQVNARRPKMDRYVCVGELVDGQYVGYDCDNGILTIGTRRDAKGVTLTECWATRCPCNYASDTLPSYAVAQTRLSRMPGFISFFDPRSPPKAREMSDGARAFLGVASSKIRVFEGGRSC